MQRTISFEQYAIDFTAHATPARELERVRKGIAVFIIEFALVVLSRESRTFHMQEMVDYVQHRKRCAPDSVSRILRLLTAQGVIQYRNSSRSESEYIIESVVHKEVDIIYTTS